MDDLRSISKLAIHQPNFLPWMGYFLKMHAADQFVILDDVQYSKGSFTARVTIDNHTHRGNQWLTVPIRKAPLDTPINQIQLDRSQNIEGRLLNLLAANYSTAQYYESTMVSVEALVPDLRQCELLSEYNQIWISWVRNMLHIDTPLIVASSLGMERTELQLVPQICLELDAQTYLSGQGGHSYLKIEDFDRHGIQIEFVDYAMIIQKIAMKKFGMKRLVNKSIIAWMMHGSLKDMRDLFVD